MDLEKWKQFSNEVDAYNADIRNKRRIEFEESKKKKWFGVGGRSIMEIITDEEITTMLQVSKTVDNFIEWQIGKLVLK